MRHNANEDTEFGIMCELIQEENRLNNISITKNFGMNSIRTEWPMLSVQYVGKTTMTHDAIKLEGMYLSFYISHWQQFELSIPIRITVFSRTTVKISQNIC